MIQSPRHYFWTKLSRHPALHCASYATQKKVDHYEVLGINRDAKPDEIKAAFYKLSKEYHPDRNQDEEAVRKFHEVNEAYEVLGNYASKKTYDRTLMTSK